MGLINVNLIISSGPDQSGMEKLLSAFGDKIVTLNQTLIENQYQAICELNQAKISSLEEILQKWLDLIVHFPHDNSIGMEKFTRVLLLKKAKLVLDIELESGLGKYNISGRMLMLLSRHGLELEINILEK